MSFPFFDVCVCASNEVDVAVHNKWNRPKTQEPSFFFLNISKCNEDFFMAIFF